MTNYYTEYITVNNVNVNDYININDEMCKVLEISNILLSNNEYIYTIKCIDLNKKIYNIRMHYNNKIHSLNRQILKYNFLYTFEIWNKHEYDEYIKIKDNFITYDDAEEYISKNNIEGTCHIIRSIDNIQRIIDYEFY